MKKSTLFITLAVLILAACTRNELAVDVSGVKAEPLKLVRLEDDLFSLKAGNFEPQSAALLRKYGPYYNHYIMGFLARRGTADTGYKASVLSFTADKDISECYACVKKLYPDAVMQKITGELDECVKRFKYHFPARRQPARLVTSITGWNYAFAYMDSTFTLGLDMYLGDTAKFYTMLRYPQYQVRKMNRHYILPDIARGWLLTEFDKNNPENTLLSHCIFYGRLFYGVNALLPQSHDSLVIGYTGQQLKYCQAFEKNLWGFFAEKNRLYENDLNTIRELTTDGPFTGVISKDCPPRIAMWVGWQIVKSYMKNNQDATLEQLMSETDARKILNKSKYRP